MSFSPQLFLTNMKAHDGPAKPSRFEVILPIPNYINTFVGNSILEQLINLPNNIVSSVTDILLNLKMPFFISFFVLTFRFLLQYI